MPDDWDWFWAGESGRDDLLRGEIEGLSNQASAARSQAARLSSQLAKVQGSLETRVSALAAAFDAYVELGDVREQLAGHPDTSAVRRHATAALEVLTRGGVPERLPNDASDYWLTEAMNAVITRAAGHPDPSAEARAVALDRDAELLLVTAAGALGHGDQVGDRVPPLLVTDGELNAAQRALWAAVVAGEYGDPLSAVRQAWQPALDAADADWPEWVGTQARAASPVEILRWVDRQIAGVRPAAPPDAKTNGTRVDPRATARSALATVTLSLIGRGKGEEVALLERARELRAKIEWPDAPAGRRATQAGLAAPQQPTVLQEVRAAFLAAEPGSPLRAELLAWLTPHLLSAVDVIVARAESISPTSVEARTPGGVIEIGADGVTPEQRQKIERRIGEQYAPAPAYQRNTPVIVAAVLVVVVLVATAVGAPVIATLAGLGALIAAGLMISTIVTERRRHSDHQGTLELASTALSKAETEARRYETIRLEALTEARQLAAGLGERLGVRTG